VIHPDALGHLEKAIALDPNHLTARLALADLYRQENLLDEAKDILLKAIAGEADVPAAHFALAEILIDEGQEEQAINHLLEASSGDLADANSRFRLAELLAAKGQVKAAADQLETVISLDHFNGEAHFLLATFLEHPDDFDRVKLLLEIATDLLPEDPRPCFHLAQLLDKGEKSDREGNLFRESDYTSARQCYEQTLCLTPSHGPANLRLGVMLEGEGNIRAAIVCYNKAAKVKGIAGDAYLCLARLALAENDNVKVENCLNLAIREPEVKAQSLLKRAEVFIEQGKTNAAKKDLIEALSTFEKDEKKFRDDSDVAADNANFIRARRRLEKAENARSSQSPVLCHLAKIEVMGGCNEKAIQLLDKAVAQSPIFVPARYELAILLDDSDRTNEAIRHYEAVVQAEWAHPRAHFRLGKIAFAEKDLNEAEMHFLIVTDLEPSNAKAIAYLAQISASKSKKET
jgi:tetratricopeptide (TPR) repeat protein